MFKHGDARVGVAAYPAMVIREALREAMQPHSNIRHAETADPEARHPVVRRLDPVLIDRIAAGEVVERPAAAVKELVENAIDAGARAISVEITDGGRRLIRVTDDGCGMHAQDLALAVERHATSKLPGGDLSDIRTLGFRGEALPSIAAVSRLTITSRPPGAENGLSMRVDAGLRQPVMPAPAMTGTRIEVADLFMATPARLKFLKSDRAEAQAVAEVVRRLAVAHPQIRFSLTGEHLTDFSWPAEEPGQEGLARRLARVLGRDFPENAISIDAAREGFALRGAIGLPTFHRGTGAHVHFVVNGRPVPRQAAALRRARRLCRRDGLGPASGPGPVHRLRPGHRRCQRPSGQDRGAFPGAGADPLARRLRHSRRAGAGRAPFGDDGWRGDDGGDAGSFRRGAPWLEQR